MTPKYYLLASLGLLLFVTIIAVTTAQFAFVPINNAMGLPDYDLVASRDPNDLRPTCPEYFNEDTFTLDLNDVVIKKLCKDFGITYDADKYDKIDENKVCQDIKCEKLIEAPKISCNKTKELPKKLNCKCTTKPKSRLKTENIQLILPPTEVEVPKGLECLKCLVPIDCISTDVGILGGLECRCDDSCDINKIQEDVLDYCVQTELPDECIILCEN